MADIDDKVTFKQIYELGLKTFKTHNEIILVEVLSVFENLYPECANAIIEKILVPELNTVEEVCKFIRQSSDYKEDIVFYKILNSDFGLKIIKIAKRLDTINKEFSLN